MLVLSRKVGEAIQVGNAMVRVLKVSGDTVRLGMEAPEDIEILREELLPAEEPYELLDLAEVG